MNAPETITLQNHLRATAASLRLKSALPKVADLLEDCCDEIDQILTKEKVSA